MHHFVVKFSGGRLDIEMLKISQRSFIDSTLAHGELRPWARLCPPYLQPVGGFKGAIPIPLTLVPNKFQERPPGASRMHDKKLSYRRGTARCVVSVEILPIATQQCRKYLRDKT